MQDKKKITPPTLGSETEPPHRRRPTCLMPWSTTSINIKWMYQNSSELISLWEVFARKCRFTTQTGKQCSQTRDIPNVLDSNTSTIMSRKLWKIGRLSKPRSTVWMMICLIWCNLNQRITRSPLRKKKRECQSSFLSPPSRKQRSIQRKIRQKPRSIQAP